MGAMPISTGPISQMASRVESAAKNPDWMRFGVGASLLTGSILLLTGKRKAGLLVTAAGTLLAMLEHREVVAEWWDALPQHLQKAQHMLDQAQQTIDDLTDKRDKLFSFFGK